MSRARYPAGVRSRKPSAACHRSRSVHSRGPVDWRQVTAGSGGSPGVLASACVRSETLFVQSTTNAASGGSSRNRTRAVIATALRTRSSRYHLAAFGSASMITNPIHEYYPGGKDNCAADRAAADVGILTEGNSQQVAQASLRVSHGLRGL